MYTVCTGRLAPAGPASGASTWTLPATLLCVRRLLSNWAVVLKLPKALADNVKKK
jgi:hypothetical protein